jgi:hypothetical protein
MDRIDPIDRDPQPAAADTARRLTGRRTAALAGAISGLAAAALVLAGLTATTSNPVPQPVSGGELALVLDDVGVGFSQAVTDLAPGDAVLRHVRLDSTGSLDGVGVTLGVSATGATTLIADGTTTRALTVTVRSCSVPWDPGTGTCSGAATLLVPATTVGALATPATLVPTLAAGASLHLQIELTLPDQDETTVDGQPTAPTVQGQEVALTYLFTMVQRDPVATTG